MYCGLCTKYQSQAPSRCIGCQLGGQHAYCSIWNCCVKKRLLERCSDCEAIFSCEIHLRRKVVEWIPAAQNLRQIMENGLEPWLDEQIERQALVETLLQNYNEGRSMSFFCKIVAKMPVALIRQAIIETEVQLQEGKVDPGDKKRKAKIVKAALQELEAGFDIHSAGCEGKTCHPL